MKPTAIYIPELGKVFFIEEIISISDITTFKNNSETLGYFKIDFKCRKKIKIGNFITESGENDNYYYEKFNIKVLQTIRNQFLQHTNIINAQETDKEQLGFDKSEINCIWHGLEIVRPELRKKVFDKLEIKLVIQSELHK